MTKIGFEIIERRHIHAGCADVSKEFKILYNGEEVLNLNILTRNNEKTELGITELEILLKNIHEKIIEEKYIEEKYKNVKK